LGIKETASWNSTTVTLKPGERLFLYTDGLTETTNATGDLFGAERIIQRLQDLAQEEAGVLMRQLIAEIDEFRGDKPVLDDMTCLVLNWRGAGADRQIRRGHKRHF
jgi:serine phosphatase RsbU (regulator of sigma subunit)